MRCDWIDRKPQVPSLKVLFPVAEGELATLWLRFSEISP